MFLRVIRDGIDTIYECKSVQVRSGQDSVLFMMEGAGVDGVDVQKKDAEVYLMNHDGRTIDTYRWIGDRAVALSK